MSGRLAVQLRGAMARTLTSRLAAVSPLARGQRAEEPPRAWQATWFAAAGCAAAAAIPGACFLASSTGSSVQCESKPSFTTPKTTEAPTRYRLVVSDLDGTLFDETSQVSAGNLKALREVISPACPLVLATARGIHEGIPFQDLPGPLYIVALGGAHGMERVPGEQPGEWKLRQLFLRGLPETCARAAVAAAESQGATMWLFTLDRVFVKPGKLGRAESEKQLAFFVKDPSYIQYVSDYEAILAKDQTLEVCAVLPKEGTDADAVAARISDTLAAYGTPAGMNVLSMAPQPIISMKAAGVDKASAIRTLCAHVGVYAEHVIAFGDAGNDVPMLQFVGHGVAVANAGAKARAAADIISIWTNQEDAVGKELLRLRAGGQL